MVVAPVAGVIVAVVAATVAASVAVGAVAVVGCSTRAVQAGTPVFPGCFGANSRGVFEPLIRILLTFPAQVFEGFDQR